MSLSREERLQDIALALRLMVEELGEQAIWERFFDPEGERYTNIYPTTWSDLELHNHIKSFHTLTSVDYQLTGEGWLAGLEASGRLPEMKKKIGSVIMPRIKERVDGRREPAFASFLEIAQAANVPESLIFNMVESDFILNALKRHSIERAEGDYVLIPINFGQEIL